MKTKKQNEFTNEEMTTEGMNELLLELYNSVYWPAIFKYIQYRYTMVDNGLRTIDPFKDPTAMARTQGFFGGLSDLLKYAEELETKAKEKEIPLSE